MGSFKSCAMPKPEPIDPAWDPPAVKPGKKLPNLFKFAVLAICCYVLGAAIASGVIQQLAPER